MRTFIQKYGWFYIPGLVFLGFSSWLQVLAPHLLGQIVDDLNVPAASLDTSAVYRGLALLMLVAAGAFLTRFAWRYFIMGASRRLETSLRQRLFLHLQNLSASFYQQQKTGNLMAYAINDIGAIRQTAGPGTALAANALVMSFLSVSSMTENVDFRLTMFALIPVPVIIVVISWLGRQIQKRFRVVQEVFAEISDRVQESISGLSVIKAYGQEEEEVERFTELNVKTRDANISMTRASASMGPVVTILFGISFSISLVYGSYLVMNGQLSLGQFVAFNGYLTLIINPVRSIARIINIMQRGMASIKRYQEIIRIEPEVKDPADRTGSSQLPESLTGHLCISDLDFAYPGRKEEALSGINIDLRPGKMIGVLGRTGSGKSTLANLILRLYEIPERTIMIDGYDIRDLPLAFLRRQIAYAPQDNFLFSTTLEENIRFFDDSYSLEQIRQAAGLADFDDTAMSFPDGYGTVVGERGMTLSGGQKQRVGLARALLLQTPLLILDDALSAVDTETEARILERLRNRLADSACLIIGNRISALRFCDEIIVLEDGRISERGNHDELLRNSGLYAAIATMQSEESSLPADGGGGL